VVYFVRGVAVVASLLNDRGVSLETNAAQDFYYGISSIFLPRKLYLFDLF
jgi:hypothetical protein